MPHVKRQDVQRIHFHQDRATFWMLQKLEPHSQIVLCLQEFASFLLVCLSDKTVEFYFLNVWNIKNSILDIFNKIDRNM